ncbi:MAG: Nramp family divalent metal transporter [Pseudomonadales bacterium]|nr:Nramp family divalent metal transporter [Pseudomonadales bacterium]MDP6472750.1 Nramp family divalent metal transporter [Pseudomonadales bacterium]MDP6827963.1 Nramp family divalent metal transporter [Pseudomonadales bacterium]MDP6971994.1 Nramp family divalent metal transporter [Pseudomonadales bacterium]
MADPYTQPGGAVLAPPDTWRARLGYLGPSVIVSGSIVGSGEIILTASLGAAAGYVLLWWMLFACWSKSIVQAELGRYTVLSGDTYLRALNRLPGKIAGPRGAVSWPILLGLLNFLPGITGLGGIVGGAGLAVSLLFPGIDPLISTGAVACVTAFILGTGGYRRLETVMLGLVMSFTFITLVCALLMQGTEYATNLDDLAAGFSFSFPTEFAVVALAAYGYTGVNSGEISAYTYWCIEKGYPGRVGERDDSPEWLERARGWLAVLRTDVWVTLIILTFATVPFYLLGAGVLNAVGEVPSGNDTIIALSGMFTETLGPWAKVLFATGAFCILFSTTLAGIAAGGRFIPDYLIEMGFTRRDDLNLRRSIIKVYVSVIPFLAFALYAFFQRPVLMVLVAGCFAAIMLPIQSGATLWLQRRYLPEELQPSVAARSLLILTFFVQLILSFAVVYYVVL